MALDLYNNTSNPFHITEGLDNVTFPFYSTYIWLVWSIFSKSLLISHLAMLPFLLGTCYQFYSLSKKFLEEKWLGFAMILLALEPTFMTQSIIMSYDVILVFLFLFLLNKLLEKKYQAYSFILPVLALYSIRGLFLAFSLGMIYFFIARMQKDLSFSKILKHHIWCIVLVISWFIYHKMKTGWFIFSPLHEHSDNQVLPFSMMLKQLAYITWKIADFGRIFLWLFVIFGFIFLKKNIAGEKLKILSLILFLPLFTLLLFMIPIANPVGHKYFTVIFLALIIAACFFLQHIYSKKIQLFLATFFSIALITGNFWLYPDRFGNGWDSSLKVLPYFELKDKMDNYIVEQNIPPEVIGTQYPLIADKRFSHLADTSYYYTNVWMGPLNDYEYFLHTNVINTDIPKQVEEVKKNWTLLRTEKRGIVYISLYKRKG